MERQAQLVVKYRYVILVLVILITGWLGYQIRFLEVNSDIISSLPDDDPDAVLLKKIGERFGGNKTGIIILETENVYTLELLEHVKQVTDSLRRMKSVMSVTSITDIIDIRRTEYGLEVGKLVDEYDLPSTPEALNELKKRVNTKDLYRGSIVSEDGTATIVVFTLLEDADIHSVATAVKEKIASLDLPERIYYAGSPMLVTSIADLIAADMSRLIPITFLVVALTLFLGFRSFRGVILPLLTAGIAILWTIGFMAWGGFKMSMVGSNIPILLVAVGSAYTIHVINRINQEIRSENDQPITAALTYIFIPVLLAALTTAIGFISFIFGSYLTMIRDYGLFTALGVCLSCLLSLTFVPAVISIFTFTTRHSEKRDRGALISTGILSRLRFILSNYPKQILIVWVALIIVSGAGTLMIKREVDIKDYFKKNNPTRIAEEIMTEKFGGIKPVFVHFQGDMQNPEVLKTMIRTQDYMKQSPDILATQSVADLIVDLNEALGEGEGAGVPESRDMIEQLCFLLEGNEYLDLFVSRDLDEGVIMSKFLSPDNQSKKDFRDFMYKFVEQNSTDEYKISITGMPFVDVTMDNSLIRSQFGSLSIAIAAVIIIVGLILRSFRSGIYAAAPIVAAIIILFGVMGFAGIPLNIGTVLVASVAVGIGIDYSIHIISHFNHSIKNNLGIQNALDDTILITGKAILINVASVSAGFLVLLFSEMVPLQYFGLLVAISMVGSSLGALTLLPVILILVNRKSADPV